MTGGLSLTDAQIALVDRGTPSYEASSTVADWECERSNTERVIPATQLCSWYTQGLISNVEMTLRLIRIGYSQFDAATIVRSCNVKLTDAKSRIDKRTADERKRDEEKALAKLEREQSKIRVASDKEERTVAREAKDRARRRKRLLKAAISVAQFLGTSIDGGAEILNAEIVRVMTDFLWSQEEAETLIVDVAKTFNGSEEVQFQLAVQEAAIAEDAAIADDGKPQQST